MSKTCQHKVPCGCEDKPLVTNPLVCESGTPDCPAPDACPETFCDTCLVHCTDSIVDLAFNQGDRFDVILQKIALYLTNPSCATPNTTGELGFVTITQAGVGYTPSTTTAGVSFTRRLRNRGSSNYYYRWFWYYNRCHYN